MPCGSEMDEDVPGDVWTCPNCGVEEYGYLALEHPARCPKLGVGSFPLDGDPVDPADVVPFKVRRCERCDEEVAVLDGETWGGYCVDCHVIDQLKERLRVALSYWGTDVSTLDPLDHAAMALQRQLCEEALAA